jgi:Raf kinase inhibitor-like YbhB/YbcL family protein
MVGDRNHGLTRIVSVLAAVALAGGCGRAQPMKEADVAHQQQPQHSPEALTLGRIQPREPAVGVELLSEAIGVDGAIDLRHTAYGDNLSPPLRWTPIEGAGAYAIVLEDPDAPRETPFVHWLIWNIPGEATSLPEGVPNNAELVSPQGARQGRNDNGSEGYFGPHPPAGHGVHHYHIQIFALDGPLGLHAGADLRTLTNAMKGRVLADGELIGTFEAPASH